MENKKRSLAELNKMKPGTKKLLIVSSALLSISLITLIGISYYNEQKAKEPYTTTETVSGRMTALSNSFYDNESSLISAFTKNSKSFEPYAVYSIGATLAVRDPESSLYKMEPISGENKTKINYFRLEDGSFLRSAFNEHNDLIVSNTQIKTTDLLDLWTKFDKLQEELGKNVSKSDSIELNKYKEIEELMSQHGFLKN